jgi:NAD(P)-dependent dehydrogenase (short-subunit alcohol dehydrogenase family)
MICDAPEQLTEQYDVNVLGSQRVNRMALPHMRGQGRGLLVWVGSSSTRGGTPPFLGPYFAAAWWKSCATTPT